MRLTFLFLIIVLIFPIIVRAEKVVIFVPGWKGTELIDVTTGKKVWARFGEVIRNRSSLTINDPEVGFSNSLKLRAGNILNGVSIIPDYLEVDAYGATLKALRAACGKGCTVKPLPYDWRQDLMEPIRLLNQAVKAEISVGNELILVGHSMGGLIVAYYLRYGISEFESAKENWLGAKSVKGVVFAGTPFRGALTIFNDMHAGIRTGLNRSLLSAEAVSSFPSTYYLLPHPDDATVVTTQGHILPSPIYDFGFYQRNGWGVLSTGDKKAREKFLNDILVRANRFSRLINADSIGDNINIPCINIIGKGHETISRAVRLSSEDSLVFYKQELPLWLQSEGSSLLYSYGDKVVPETSATLPHGFSRVLNCKSIQNSELHHRLFLDRSTVNNLGVVLSAFPKNILPMS